MSIRGTSIQKGQALAEVLIAVVIAGIMIGGIVSTIGTSLITGKKTRQVTAATGLAQEDTEAIKTIASSNWLTVYCPPAGSCPGNKGSSNHYKIVLSDGTWQVQSGVATSTVDGVVYTHYFYLDNVNRDEGGDIAESGTEDPSTQKAAVVVTWSGETNFTISEYIMRVTSASFRDFNWSFNNFGEGPYTYSQGTYSTSSNIAISSSSIELQNYTSSGYLISSTFDTGVAAGAAFNNIMWKGEKPSDSYVRFQFASSNSTSTWTFIGPNGTDATYYEASVSNVAIPITTFYHNNHRYFRYKIYLYPTSDNTQGPTVTDVIIGYSP